MKLSLSTNISKLRKEHSMTQEQFDAFIKAVADRSSGKVEKKDE